MEKQKLFFVLFFSFCVMLDNCIGNHVVAGNGGAGFWKNAVTRRFGNDKLLNSSDKGVFAVRVGNLTGLFADAALEIPFVVDSGVVNTVCHAAEHHIHGLTFAVFGFELLAVGCYFKLHFGNALRLTFYKNSSRVANARLRMLLLEIDNQLNVTIG